MRVRDKQRRIEIGLPEPSEEIYNILRRNGYKCEPPFCYNPSTGDLATITQPDTVQYCKGPGKFYTRTIHTHNGRGRRQSTHVMYWIMTGEWPTKEQVIDHIDRNPLNMKFDNLRLTDTLGNARNKKMPERTWNGIKLEQGASYIQFSKRFQVVIRGAYMGSYKTIEEANAVAKELRRKLNGEHAFDYDPNYIQRRRI